MPRWPIISFDAMFSNNPIYQPNRVNLQIRESSNQYASTKFFKKSKADYDFSKMWDWIISTLIVQQVLYPVAKDSASDLRLK